jgi:hypothetical protein
VVLLLVGAGFVLGGVVGVAFGGVSSLFLPGVIPWIVGAVAGGPVFLLVVVIPLSFINGLMLTYISTTWTLTYRELRALEAVAGV